MSILVRTLFGVPLIGEDSGFFLNLSGSFALGFIISFFISHTSLKQFPCFRLCLDNWVPYLVAGMVVEGYFCRCYLSVLDKPFSVDEIGCFVIIRTVGCI
ncbi:hypothetical protein Droror1_Dr00017258 [Drosera rotundifolia]